MAFLPGNSLLFFQLSLLLSIPLTAHCQQDASAAAADAFHVASHSQLPSPSPAAANTPLPPPQLPVRSLVALEGVVECMYCIGGNSSTAPLLGATVKLACNNTAVQQTFYAKTNKDGYFYLNAGKNLTSYGAGKCNLTLSSSPNVSCDKPLNNKDGSIGSVPTKSTNISANPPINLYNMGTLFFASNSTSGCPKF